MSEYIDNLEEAIEAMHGCHCRHYDTERVREEYEGELIWEGDVEIFQVNGLVDAKLAYGWAWKDAEGETQYLGILHKRPIKSASDAVKAAIASGQFG